MTPPSHHPVTVRGARPRDAGGCLDIYAPLVRDTPISFETKVPSVEEFARRIVETIRHYPWLVGEMSGDIAAYAYARRHRERAAYRWSVEVSVYVAQEYRRRGVGREVYSQLLDLLARQGLVNAFAGIALPNPASVAFHQSLGFEPVGVYRKVGFKLGRWHDVGWWGRRLSQDDGRPSDPIPFSRLRP